MAEGIDICALLATNKKWKRCAYSDYGLEWLRPIKRFRLGYFSTKRSKKNLVTVVWDETKTFQTYHAKFIQEVEEAANFVKVAIKSKWLAEECDIAYGSLQRVVGMKVVKNGVDVLVANEKTKDLCPDGKLRLKWYEYRPCNEYLAPFMNHTQNVSAPS